MEEDVIRGLAVTLWVVQPLSGSEIIGMDPEGAHIYVDRLSVVGGGKREQE